MNNEIKQETFLFTDEQIMSKIDIYKTEDPVKIMFYLYKDLDSITKKEYFTEVTQYLYTNCIESKDKIDTVIQNNFSWFYNQYDKAVNGETSYFHAVQSCRNQLMGFLHYKPQSKTNNTIGIVDDE